MQDIRKKHSTSKSNFPISRDFTPRGDSTISHIGLSGEETRRPRFARSDDISVYKTAREEKREEERDSSNYESKKRSSPGRTWRKVKSILSFSFVLAIFLAGYYVLTYVFDRATITITPNYRDTTLTGTVITAGENGQIPYETVTTEASKTKTLPTTTTTNVDKKATGEIIVYNNFSTAPQRLVKFTRFESTNKKIYKIPDSIVVPGKVGDTPGELKVKVYAESEGSSYNTDSDSFTIPGFKGKDQFTKIYAKTSGPITGGASGSKAVVALTDLNAAKDELALSLRETIKKDFAAKTFEKKVPLLDTVTLKIEDNASQVLQGETSTYSAKATGYVALVDASALSKLTLGGDVNKALSYTFIPGKSLNISASDATPLLASSTLSLAITGGARIIWATDYEALRDKITGKSKKNFMDTVAADKTISTATLSIFPPWKTELPKRKNSILVKEKLPDYKL